MFYLSGQIIQRFAFGAVLIVIAVVLLTQIHVAGPPVQVRKPFRYHNSKTLSALDLWRIRGPNSQKKLELLFEGEVDAHEEKDEYAHQHAFHIPQDPIGRRECNAIPTWRLQDIAMDAGANLTGNLPLMYHFHGGALVTDPSNRFETGTEFCSVIFAPQIPEEELDQYSFRNKAIEGWGPDSIHCEIASDDVRLIPEHPSYWGALSVSAPHMGWASASSRTHATLAVYTVPYALNHPGSYQFNGEVEFQSYDWVMEDPIDMSVEQHDYFMIENSLQTKSPALTITGHPLNRPSQKCHEDGFNDVRGRWYRAKAFAKGGKQTRLNPRARLEYADHNATVDEWGWTFAPDACSLPFFTPADHATCFANRTIQILGDSNSRRLTKSLIGGGVGWCTDPEDRTCNCEDTFEESIHDMHFDNVTTERFRDTTIRDTTTPFGNSTNLYFDFVGGLINAKLFNSWRVFYDRPTPSESTLIESRQSANGPIDVVHISLLGWDMAAIRTPAQILDSLPTFRNTVLRAYPPGTRFLTRLANSICCGNQNHRTRYSGPRFRMWNAMWRQYWAADEARGKVLVHDPSVLQGRRDAEVRNDCPTTHLRASHVRIEQMLWMSAVCNKAGPTGEGVVAAKDAARQSAVSHANVTMRAWGFTKAELDALGPGLNELKDADAPS